MFIKHFNNVFKILIFRKITYMRILEFPTKLFTSCRYLEEGRAARPSGDGREGGETAALPGPPRSTASALSLHWSCPRYWASRWCCRAGYGGSDAKKKKIKLSIFFYTYRCFLFKIKNNQEKNNNETNIMSHVYIKNTWKMFKLKLIYFKSNYLSVIFREVGTRFIQSKMA